VRYWDGQLWTTWVADGDEAFDERSPVILIRRRRAYGGLLVRTRVLIDGELAGYLASGESHAFPVSDGPHRVRIKQFWSGSRELDVVVPPAAEMVTGPRGGYWAAFFLGIVQPHRTLQLEQESDPEPPPSRWLVATGAFIYVALIVTLNFAMQRLIA
jgi:hypothetical protein